MTVSVVQPNRKPSMTASYVIAPPPQAAIAIQGDDKKFPVRRIWCVGRN